MNREQWIIERLRKPAWSSVSLGIGDDAAALAVGGLNTLLICHDTLNAGTHFLAEDPPDSIGHRCLAVNLSDIAAMGGKPRWASLSLSLPSVEDAWVDGFVDGFHGLAEEYGVELVGGDTTRGPLSLSVCLLGEPHPEGLLTRSGARPGDIICVSGSLGEAAHALRHPGSQSQHRLWYPLPRVRLGQALVGVASSALDLSDGLLVDLPRLLGSFGATIAVDDIPVGDLAERVDSEAALQFAISGGDDYELCFTVPKDRLNALKELASACASEISIIGRVTDEPGVNYHNSDGSAHPVLESSYDHFAQ